MPEEKRIRIGVCLPLYNQVTSVFFIHFIKFFVFAARKYGLEILQLDGTLVDVARNVLVTNFLKTNCDYLLFLDSDIVFPPNIIDLLAKHDKDLVSALYFSRKKNTPQFKVFRENDYYIPDKIPPNTLLKVDAVGMGCVLIKRKVLEELDKEHKDKPLFLTKYQGREKFWGEDIYFSDLIRRKGFELYVDTGVIVGHYGGIIPEQSFKDYIY